MEAQSIIVNFFQKAEAEAKAEERKVILIQQI